MTAAELLDLYDKLGFKLCYWVRPGADPKEWKGPHGDKTWNDPKRKYPIELYDQAKMNLGVFTGAEIQPGKFLIDVDLDWAPGIDLAVKLLPSTSFAFGRKGKKISHAFYTVSERTGVFKYCDVDDDKGTGDGITFVELRGGEYSHQSMIAPSLHSPGVHIELVVKGAILHLEQKRLLDGVLDYAIGCLLLQRCSGGLHHDGRQALAGYLLHAGIPPERVQAIGEEVCRVQASRRVPDMSSRDVADMSQVVRTTIKRLESGKKFVGGPSLAAFIGEKGKHVVARINKWLGRDDDFIRDGNNKIVAKNQENVKRALELLQCRLTYDQFAARPLLNDERLEDPQVVDAYLRIESEHHFSPPFDYFRMVVENAAHQNGFHPVKQYLDSLTWDAVPRVDEWLITAANAEDSEYVRAISSIFLVAAVRRVRQPGCKYDEMLVLESPQGGLKSSAIQALCPDPRWFTDDLQLNARSQQLIEATLGKWIVEASDLAGKRKTEIEQLKAMMSRQVDGPARMAYAHLPVEHPRHFIMIGTTNSSIYLTDPTGGRRFWPTKVGKFNVQWVKDNRDQLWAEACVREARGESIRLAEELWPDAAEQQEKRREIDPWETVLRTFLIALEPNNDERRRVSTNELWEALSIQVERRDRTGALRMSDIMQRLGFRRATVRVEGVVQTGYVTDDASKLHLAEESRVPGEDDEPSSRAAVKRLLDDVKF